MLWTDLLPAQSERLRDLSEQRPLLVLVCGSRDWGYDTWIAQRLVELPANTQIMHGGARGPDTASDIYARSFGMPKPQVFRANWKLHGKRAGFMRNVEMLDQEPDLVIAFWDGESRGTKHTIEEARKRGILVEVITKVESGVNVDVLV